MLRHVSAVVLIAVLTVLAAGNAPSAAAQDQEYVREIQARARVFPEIGPGVAAIKRDTTGRYYILAAPATTVAIYGADGARIGQIPNANSRGAKITYASDIDLSADGLLFVADRGANAVRTFNIDGSPVATAHVAAPLSIAALSGHEFAAALLQSEKLVSVFDAQGKLVRAIGDVPASAPSKTGGASLSHGHLFGDGAGHLYFAFTDLDDPTVRRYDRYGSATSEITLPAAEFRPPSEPRQWNTVTLGKSGAPPTKPAIRALAVDPETQEVWAAIGDELLHFDKDGIRRAAYRTSTKQGARVVATSIVVEHDRILIADDPNGIFDFAYPEPRHAAPTDR
jgi:hypothetical protein